MLDADWWVKLRAETQSGIETMFLVQKRHPPAGSLSSLAFSHGLDPSTCATAESSSLLVLQL